MKTIIDTLREGLSCLTENLPYEEEMTDEEKDKQKESIIEARDWLTRFEESLA